MNAKFTPPLGIAPRLALSMYARAFAMGEAGVARSLIKAEFIAQGQEMEGNEMKVIKIDE